jgi:small subunit ribosomal protein S1
VIDENMEGEESFAELFERSLTTERRRVHPGEKVSGRVVQVGHDRAIVDLGDGIDAIIELSELAEKGAPPTVKVGDPIEAFVVRLENRVAVLAKSLGKGAGSVAALEQAAATGIPVEGLVTEVNRGGYVVEISGIRCFCPLGQMDLRRIEDPATMIGQKLSFRVQELKEGRGRGGPDVVLSRRALLEAEQASRAAQTRAKLEVGARFTGTVTSVRDFGAFVDLGGLDGLVPASELGYGRLRVQDVVHQGQTVEVQVLRIEPPGPKDRSERITLSMRSLAEDPWEQTVAELPVGTTVRGTVVRIQPFGAFVEIVPGVDGLLHVSAFGRRVAHPSDVVTVGDSIAVQIDGIDSNQRRISLSYVDPKNIVETVEEPTVETAAPAPAATPIPAPAPRTRATGTTSHVGGLKVRHVERVAVPAVAPVSVPAPAMKSDQEAAKPRIVGRTPVAAETGAPEVARPRAASANPQPGQVVEVAVDKIEPFGLLVRWGTLRGLVPANELEVPKGADLKKAFPVGSTFKAAITEVRGDGRIRLSAKAAAQEEERAEARSWMQSNKTATRGFGTLGDLLKGKI